MMCDMAMPLQQSTYFHVGRLHMSFAGLLAVANVAKSLNIYIYIAFWLRAEGAGDGDDTKR